MAYTTVPALPWTVAGSAAGTLRVRRKAAGATPVGLVATASVPAAATVPAHVTAFNAAVGGTLSAPAQAALANLYNQLVAAGLWAKVQALYLFLPGTTESSFNFRDSSTFRLTYYGGLTSGAAGLASDGTGYYDTGFVPANHASSPDNLAFDVFEDFRATDLAYSLGVSDYSGGHQIGIYRGGVVENHSDTMAYMSSDTNVSATFLFNAHTMLSFQRSAGGLLQLYQYGRKVSEVTAPANGLGVSFSVYGFAKNNFGGANSIATGTHRHLAIRQALTDAEVERFAHILHEYHIATGRTQKADVFFGDSVSHELNVVDSWPQRYTGKAGTLMQNFAVSGQIGQNVLADGTFAAQLPTYNPAIHRRLFLAHGTNDDNNGESAGTYADVLAAFIDRATLTQGWPAGSVVAMPAFYQKSDNNGVTKRAYLAACSPMITSKGAVLMNIYQFMKDRPNADAELFGSDSVHPLDPVGPEFIANTVFSKIG